MCNTLTAVHAQPVSGHPSSDGGHLGTLVKGLLMLSADAMTRGVTARFSRSREAKQNASPLKRLLSRTEDANGLPT
jgi:hypothetical protein